jgi:hypothetical protein
MATPNDWHTAVDEAYDRVSDVLRQEWARMSPQAREGESFQKFVRYVTQGIEPLEDPTSSMYCYLPEHIGDRKVTRAQGQCPVCFDTTSYPMEMIGGDDRE